jgi:hypothetical protein
MYMRAVAEAPHAAKGWRVSSLKSALAVWRTAFGAIFALGLAFGLLSPVGFMPSFDHGAVTIVACPDYEATPSPIGHHHGGHGAKHEHQFCPYAAGAGAGTAPDLFLFCVPLLFGGTLLLRRTYELRQGRRSHERPPLRGPPATA